jgi:hypothetical protein
MKIREYEGKSGNWYVLNQREIRKNFCGMSGLLISHSSFFERSSPSRTI